jgi:acetolactate synthase I/II/III large subunit
MVTVAELVIREAMARGNRYIFGIPGSGPGLSLISAAHAAGCRFVLVNNEATAAMAASVYGQLNGAPGVCFSIQGTGGGNMVGGVVACYLERGPVVAITDRHPDSIVGQVRWQNAHLTQVFPPIVKGSMTLHPASARSVLRSAFDLAWAERPGPVHVDFPADLADKPVTETEQEAVPAAPSPAFSDDLAPAIEALRAAKRVVVIVGSDAMRVDAASEIRSLVENSHAVALSSWRARGLLPEDHPRYGTTFYGLFVPETGEMDFLTRADLVVLVGVDPVEVSQPWPKGLPILQVQSSPDLDNACSSGEYRLYGPLKSVLGQLGQAGTSTAGFGEREIRAIRGQMLERFAPQIDAPPSTQGFMAIARKYLPRNGVFIQETGVHNVLNEHVWPVYQGETYISSGGSRTMGAAIPWAIGAALARPGVPVLACSGDGGFLMRLQELEVVARMGLGVVFLIFDDGQLGTIKARALARGMDLPGLDFAPVDFSAIARGFGLRAATVDCLDKFEEAMKQALAADCATVIDIKVDPVSYMGLFPRMLGTGSPVREMAS